MSILNESQKIQSELTNIRKQLHMNPELDMALAQTIAFVRKTLTEMGIESKMVGTAGITALIGNGKGPTVLLRADMDALPVKEEAEIDFPSTNGAMHACGHDIHTTMLLGAAKLLKAKETEINGYVKLMFQPGEETLRGAVDMVNNGILENPKVDAAMMIHVMTGMPLPTGKVLLPDAGPVSASADIFEIKILGKGGHGAMPEQTIDPLNIAAHLHLALQAIPSREVGASDPVALTIGCMSGGTAHNVIPDYAVIKGSIRTFNDQTREFIAGRLHEITNSVVSTFRGKAEINFIKGCPSVVNDEKLYAVMQKTVTNTLGSDAILSLSDLLPGGKMMGSEDFSFVTKEVPSIMISIVTGDAREGYNYPMHHPKAKFDVQKIHEGSAIYAQFALDYLHQDH